MSSSQEMSQYALEILSELGDARVRRMFGQYCLYLNGKAVGFIIDDQLLVKTNESMRKKFPDRPTQRLFEGAVNPMWIVQNPDDRNEILELYGVALNELPAPDSKSKSKGKGTNKKQKIARAREGLGSPLNDPDLL